MKYYIIAGASGICMALICESLVPRRQHCRYPFLGGDMMESVGGTLVKHYRDWHLWV
jgi:lipid-A-disaccharide synthase